MPGDDGFITDKLDTCLVLAQRNGGILRIPVTQNCVVPFKLAKVMRYPRALR